MSNQKDLAKPPEPKRDPEPMQGPRGTPQHAASMAQQFQWRGRDVFGQLGSDSPSIPLQPVYVGDSKVKFIYGTLNGSVPQIDGNPLEPVLADSPELTISGSGVFYLSEEWDDRDLVTPVPLEFAASLPANTYDGSTGDGDFYKLVGAVTVDGDVVTVVRNLAGSQEAKACLDTVVHALT